MVRKCEVFPPTTPYCVTTLPSKTNTTANIGDSIKMMCGCSSQVAMLDVSSAILGNTFKTSTSFIDTVITEMLWEFLPLGDYRSLQLFHRLESSLVVDSLLKSTLNSVFHGIDIRAIWRPCEVQWSWCALFSDSPSWSGRCALGCIPLSTCNDDTLLWCQAADPFRGWYCSSMLAFAPGSMKTTLVFPIRYSDRHHDVATEV